MIPLAAAASAQDRGAYEVLVVSDAPPAEVDGFRARLARTGLLRDTDPWDLATAGVPSFDDLAPYDAVLVWLAGTAPADPALAGVLAAMAEQRGGRLVVTGAACDATIAPGIPWRSRAPWSGGRLATSGGEVGLRSGPDDPFHGVLGEIPAGTSSRCTGLSAPRSPLVWSDGEPLVAIARDGRVAGVNLDPAAVGGQGAQAVAEALVWSTGRDVVGCRRATPEADRNCNGVLAGDELPVDPADPDCDDFVGASRDQFLLYPEWGCEIPLAATSDVDGDGLGSGGLGEGEVEHLGWTFATPRCDRCPAVPDPLAFDRDCDDVGDLCDQCPWTPGAGDPLAFDRDGDGIVDGCDACPAVPDPLQDNDDGDEFGNACDVCPFVTDPRQHDTDGDGIGDACDPCPHRPGDAADADGDGFGDRCDTCPEVPDREQEDVDLDGTGDRCDVCPFRSDDQQDADRDGHGDACDSCPTDPDAPQGDSDGDGHGDACDPCPTVADEDRSDLDGDGIPDRCDVCLRALDPLQRDADGDRVGDVCDNCPTVPNVDQSNRDADQFGDVCEAGLLRGGGRLCATAPGGGAGWALLAAAAARRRRR